MGGWFRKDRRAEEGVEIIGRWCLGNLTRLDGVEMRELRHRSTRRGRGSCSGSNLSTSLSVAFWVPWLDGRVGNRGTPGCKLSDDGISRGGE